MVVLYFLQRQKKKRTTSKQQKIYFISIFQCLFPQPAILLQADPMVTEGLRNCEQKKETYLNHAVREKTAKQNIKRGNQFYAS